MEVAGLVFSAVRAVLQLYKVAEAAYDFYHDVKDFRLSYHELFLCLEIERFRFKQWGDHTLSESRLEEAKAYPSELKLFELFEAILGRVCDTFSESSQRMSAYGDDTRNERSEGKRNSFDHVEGAAGDYPQKKSYQTRTFFLTCYYRELAGC